MQIIADTHTHSVACSHAYSTILENINEAKEKGLKFICHTEHCPAMDGSPDELYFKTLEQLPPVMHGVNFITGCETNIISYDGKLDLPDDVLARLDWVIASYHVNVWLPATEKQHTQGWLAIAQNPLVDVIGHCDDRRYHFDLDTVIAAFKENHKIVEINNKSLNFRTGSFESCREIALVCKKYRVPVVVSSDAHIAVDIANVADSVRLLQEIDYPEELILNADYDRFLNAVRPKCHQPKREFCR